MADTLRPTDPGKSFSDLARSAPGRLLAVGDVAAEGQATGRARYLANSAEAWLLQAGEIALVEALTPDWAPALHAAGALVVNADDPQTCAIAAALGRPALVGAQDGASVLWNGAQVTVIAEAGAPGRAYQVLAGKAPSSRPVPAFL